MEPSQQVSYTPFDELEDVPAGPARDARLPHYKFQPKHVLVERMDPDVRRHIRRVLVFRQDTDKEKLRKLLEYADSLSCPLDGAAGLLRQGMQRLLRGSGVSWR